MASSGVLLLHPRKHTPHPCARVVHLACLQSAFPRSAGTSHPQILTALNLHQTTSPSNPRPRITDYLYNLSEAFNQFYQECKVVGSEQETSRLLLAEATARVMRKCFELLGITPLYKI